MVAQLRIANGPLKGAIFPLPMRGIFLLGRSPCNDAQLHDRSVDAYHCAFVRGSDQDDDDYLVVDLHSQSGTRVNGVRVDKAVLRDGSAVVIGDTEVRFHSSAAAGDGPVPLSPADALGLLDAQRFQQRRARMALAALAQARATIRWTAGARKGEEVTLDPSMPLYFGRTRTADVVLTDPGASRHQALVAYDIELGQFRIFDLHSTNGTMVNDRPITVAALEDGDIVAVGAECSFLVNLTEATEAETRGDETRELTHLTMALPRARRHSGRSGLRRRRARRPRPAPEFAPSDTALKTEPGPPKQDPPNGSLAARHTSSEKDSTPDHRPKQKQQTHRRRPKRLLVPIARLSHTECPFSEAYRTLRTNLDLTTHEGVGRCVVVTSPGPQEGKTCVAVNLAISVANVGLKTLLMECDLRRAQLHHVFHIPARPGLVNYLGNPSTLNGHLRPTNIENLWVLPRGSRAANPTELLHSEVLAQLLEELRRDFDLIVVDTPPMLTVADASALSPLTDGYLVVLRARKTPREAAIQAVKQLQMVHGRILGAVLNDVSPKDHAYRYYHLEYRYK